MRKFDVVLYDKNKPDYIGLALKQIDFIFISNPSFLLADVEFHCDESGQDIGLKYYYEVMDKNIV